MKTLIACSIFTILMGIGCKKDTPNSPTPPDHPHTCRIRSIDDNYGVRTYGYAAGKLSKVTLSDGTYTTYTAGPGTLTIAAYTATGTKLSESVATTTAHGYITNWKTTNDYTYTATYTSDGYITQLELYDDNNVLQYRNAYTFVSGNLISIAGITRKSNGQYDSTHSSFEYFYDKENKGGIAYYDYHHQWHFFVKPNKNLLYKARDGFTTYTYTYFLDKDSLPTQGTKLSSTGGSPFKYSFTCD